MMERHLQVQVETATSPFNPPSGKSIVLFIRGPALVQNQKKEDQKNPKKAYKCSKEVRIQEIIVRSYVIDVNGYHEELSGY